MALDTLKVIASFVVALLLMSRLGITGFPPMSQLISAIALQVPLFGLKGLLLLIAQDWTKEQLSAGVGALMIVLMMVVGFLADFDIPLMIALLIYGVLGGLFLGASYFSWCRADLR